MSQVLSHRFRAVQWRFGGEGSPFESKSRDRLNICFHLISDDVKLHVVSKLKTRVSEEKKEAQSDGCENIENLGKLLRRGFMIIFLWILRALLMEIYKHCAYFTSPVN